MSIQKITYSNNKKMSTSSENLEEREQISTLRIRSSIEKLPPVRSRAVSSMSMRKKPQIPGSIEDLSTLKLKITETEQKIRQIKAKTARMNQEIRDKKSAVSKALSKKNDSRSIKTASDSTLENLSQSLQVLRNTYEARKEELKRIKKDDSLYLSQELEFELQMYYLENKRLHGQVAAAKNGSEIVKQQIQIKLREIENYNKTKKNIDQFKSKIKSNVDELLKYQKSEVKMWKYQISQNLNETAQNEKDTIKMLEVELDDLQKEIDEGEKRMQELDSQDQSFMEELQKIIEDQTEKIKVQVEEMNKKRNGQQASQESMQQSKPMKNE